MLGPSPFSALSAALVLAVSAQPAAAQRSTAPVRFDIRAGAEDAAEAERIAADLAAGRARIEAFFALPFREDVLVQVYPDRAAFTASFRPEWGMTETACWMVATGVADRLAILSPRVWHSEACEHDAGDAEHVRGIVVHELVHVFHGQHNPTRDFTGAEELGWFIEGLAVYASGQLDEGHLAPALEAVEGGHAPERLQDAWSGRWRYAVSGTLVQFLDEALGRATLREMLAATSERELLAATGFDEHELLARWADFVRGAPAWAATLGYAPGEIGPLRTTESGAPILPLLAGGARTGAADPPQAPADGARAVGDATRDARAARRYTLDLAAGRLAVSDTPFPERFGWTRRRPRLHAPEQPGLVVVDGAIGSQPVVVAVDPGAAHSRIPGGLAATLGLVPAGQREPAGQRVRIDALTLGEVTLAVPAAEVVSSSGVPPGIQVHLGRDVLAGVRLSVDADSALLEP